MIFALAIWPWPNFTPLPEVHPLPFSPSLFNESCTWVSLLFESFSTLDFSLSLRPRASDQDTHLMTSRSWTFVFWLPSHISDTYLTSIGLIHHSSLTSLTITITSTMYNDHTWVLGECHKLKLGKRSFPLTIWSNVHTLLKPPILSDYSPRHNPTFFPFPGHPPFRFQCFSCSSSKLKKEISYYSSLLQRASF